jgi:hypothetical protein
MSNPILDSLYPIMKPSIDKHLFDINNEIARAKEALAKVAIQRIILLESIIADIPLYSMTSNSQKKWLAYLKDGTMIDASIRLNLSDKDIASGE